MHANDMMTMEKLQARREEILRIARNHGARDVRVFGSVAVNEASADSDVDFLVEMEPGRNVLDVSELILDLQDALGRDVDVIVLRGPSESSERIQREAVPL